MLPEVGSVVGPYRLLEPLGRGGMGMVWRAVHQLSGQQAALKTVKVLSEPMLASLRREIHALARIRHPGVVRILEEGLHDAAPWYAMELVAGLPMKLYLAELAVKPAEPPPEPSPDAETERAWWTQSLVSPGVKPTGPEMDLPTVSPQIGPEPETGPQPGPPAQRLAARPVTGPAIDLMPRLTLIRRLCAPLAFLHGEGLVHRDLKPDNVLVRTATDAQAEPGLLGPVGMPVLVDFGLAAQFSDEISRETLRWAGDASGTVAYMAPEQIRGELVDARADLYSLGCMLYELVTGRKPFPGRSRHEIAAAHLFRAPEPPSRLVPGLPPLLDALVLHLLSKDPRDRLGYAEDVARLLGRLGAKDGMASGRPKARPYLYRPGFGGRHDELSQLEQKLDSLGSRQGELVLVGGQSGIGKTRLVLEVTRAALAKGVPVLLGESPAPGQESGPLGTLRRPLQQIADRCLSLGLAETERVLGRRGKVLALYEPAFRSLPGQDAHPAPAELGREAGRQRLYSDLADTLEALTATDNEMPRPGTSGPLLLVLDDLQWADELTMGFVQFLVSSGLLERLPLLVLGTYRSDEAGADLQALLQNESVQGLVLGRLDEKAVGSMADRMLALLPAPETLTRHLARHSEGNPFFVAEYLRAAVDEGLLRRDEQGRWQTEAVVEALAATSLDEARSSPLALPRSLRALMQRRLADLPEAAQAVLEAACVLGREVPWGWLERRPAEAMAGVDELLRRQVLEEARPGTGAPLLRFAHDKLREVAYEQLGPERRAALHREAAESLETLYADRPDAPLAALGAHWEQAREPLKAQARYLAAARKACASCAYVDAVRLYGAGLRVAPEPTFETVNARLELGMDVLVSMGRHTEAEAELRQAEAEAERLGDATAKVKARADLAWIAQTTGRTEEASELYDVALRLAQELGKPKIRALVLGRYAGFLGDRGRLAEAYVLGEEALVLQRQLGNRVGEASMLSLISQLHIAEGRSQQALELGQQALALAREIGDRQSEAIYLGNLGVDHAREERWPETELHYEQALAVFREIGNRRGEGVFMSNLAHLHAVLGRVEQARDHYARALALHREVGNKQFQVRVSWEQARLERLCAPVSTVVGHGPDPEALVQRAEVMARQLGNPVYLGLSLHQRGHLELARGRSASTVLAELRPLAEGLHFTSKSELSQSLDRLERAQRAFDAGEMGRLYRGELIEEIPEGLRQWLMDNGRLGARPEPSANERAL